MIVVLFLLADLWMVYAGFRYGRRFLRDYGNWLLGLEWVVVATSGTNFLLWALLGGDHDSPLYFFAYFLDAFSRSVGITLILVLGMMRLTHDYRPSARTDVALFVLAAAAGLYLQRFHDEFHLGPAVLFLVVYLLTAVYLVTFARRLRAVGEDRQALALVATTVAGLAIALMYDFFPIPGDDADRSIFYTLALTTWGTQLYVCFTGYRALHDRLTAGEQHESHRLRLDAAARSPDAKIPSRA